MKILIDLQACQSASSKRGIGRYSHALALAIARNCRNNDVHVLLNAGLLANIRSLMESFSWFLPKKNIHCYSTPEFPAMKLDSWAFCAAHLIRSEYISRLKPDFLHVSSLFEWWDIPVSIKSTEVDYKTSVTLYDLIPLSRPETLPSHPYAKSWYHHQLDQLKSAAPIFAISEYAKSEAVELLKIPESEITPIGAGVSELFFNYSPSSELKAVDSLKNWRIFRPFALTVGVIEKRKNYPRLIEAWAKLPSETRFAHQLVIVSNTICEETRREMKNMMQRFGIGSDEILLLKDKDDEELQILYRNCKVFVMPSLHEGFGLPAAEAMVCGAAAIGSNTTSLPEVLSKKEALFDPLVVSDITAKLHEALTDDGFRHMLQRHSHNSASRFSWDSVALEVLKCFESRRDAPASKKEFNGKPYREKMLELLTSIPHPASDLDLRNAAHSVAENRLLEKKQLLIDASVLAKTDAKTGIQRVVRNISKSLGLVCSSEWNVRLIRCVNGNWSYASELENRLLGGSTNSSDAQERVEVFKGDIFLGADLGLEYIPSQNEWFQYIRARGVEIVFIVYDILPAVMPHYFHSGIANQFVPWLREIHSQADKIVCISETVSRELSEWFRGNQLPRNFNPKISYFHLGSELDAEQFAQSSSENSAVVSRDTSVPTFLLVSTIEPRKGHRQVLEAFDHLWNEGEQLKLVLIGKGGWNVDDLLQRIEGHSQLNKKLFWLKQCEDKELEQWYLESTALISASYGEGFGLPLIEAAQRKLPLIVRDIPVYREVAGSQAYYFSAESPLELKNAIREWVLLFRENKHPRSEQIPCLTWKASAKMLLGAIEHAAIAHENR